MFAPLTATHAEPVQAYNLLFAVFTYIGEPDGAPVGTPEEPLATLKSCGKAVDEPPTPLP